MYRRQEQRAQAHGGRAARRGRTVLHHVPDILDVASMAELLRRPGLHGRRTSGDALRDRRARPSPGTEADYELVRRLRASFCVLGPLLARCGRAPVALPGGDAIGSRGVDLHVAGLTELGAGSRASTATWSHARRTVCTGAHVWLDFPSVGATENILMAAVLATRHDGDRQRRSRAGDRRPVPPCSPDGRPDRRRRDARRSRSRA